MTLSVIITNYKTLDSLKLCLSSVFCQKTNFDFEVIVADIEADFENCQTITDDFPGVIYLPLKENSGLSKAVNAALKISNGELKFIMNADIAIKEQHGLKRLVEYISSKKDIGILGPALLNFDGSVQNSCFRYYTPLTILMRRSFLKKSKAGKKIMDEFLMKKELANRASFSDFVEADWLMGAALLFQKDFFKKTGLFDERFFMYFEDVDIAKRAHNASYKVVYFPAVEMYHYHQKASQKKGGLADLFTSKYAIVHILSACKYFLKHGFKK